METRKHCTQVRKKGGKSWVAAYVTPLTVCVTIFQPSEQNQFFVQWSEWKIIYRSSGWSLTHPPHASHPSWLFQNRFQSRKTIRTKKSDRRVNKKGGGGEGGGYTWKRSLGPGKCEIKKTFRVRPFVPKNIEEKKERKKKRKEDRAEVAKKINSDPQWFQSVSMFDKRSP